MYFKKWADFRLMEENANTSGSVDVKPIVPTELQTKLMEWNKLYSQSFKFKNDMPKNVGEKTTLQELLSVIDERYVDSVNNGIKQMVELLKAPDITKYLTTNEIEIVGYTSTTGPKVNPEAYNQSLSLRRSKIVKNVIESELLLAKSTPIQIITSGEGQNVDSLIIVNDKDLKPIVLGKNAQSVLSAEFLADLNKSQNVKDRQVLNRRVKITLPQFKAQEPSVAVLPKKEVIIEKPKAEVKKPIIPEPSTIKFNFDSYILQKESQQAIFQLANGIKAYNESKPKDPIKDIYISVHTDRKQDNAKPEMRSLANICGNRVDNIKNILNQVIADTNLNIHMYPVAWMMNNEADKEKKKAVISFEKNEHMIKAEEVSNKFCNKYDIDFDNVKGAMIESIIDDKIGIKLIFEKINSHMNAGYYGDKDRVLKLIPLELWYDSVDGFDYFGLGLYKNIRDEFKNDCKKIFEKHNYQNPEIAAKKFVYTAY